MNRLPRLVSSAVAPGGIPLLEMPDGVAYVPAVDAILSIPNLYCYWNTNYSGSMFQGANPFGALTGDGQTCGYWYDLAGNGRFLVEATSARRPMLDTTGMDGGPCLIGDDTDDRMTCSFSGTLSSCTVVLVYQLQDTGVQCLTNANASGSRLEVAVNSGPNYTMQTNTATVATFGAPDTNIHTLFAYFDSTNSTFEIDGGGATPGTVAVNAWTNFRIWTNQASAVYSNVKVGLAMIVNGAISGADRTVIRNQARVWYPNLP